MNMLKVGKIVGKIEGLISKIDCGTLVTKKNQNNELIKNQSMRLLEDLQNALNE